MKINLTDWEVAFLDKFLGLIPQYERNIDREKFENLQNKIGNVLESILTNLIRKSDQSYRSKYIRCKIPHLRNKKTHSKRRLNA
jgi:hypothetical protein